MACVCNITIGLESNWGKELGCYTSIISTEGKKKKKITESHFGKLKSLWKTFMNIVVIKQKEK